MDFLPTAGAAAYVAGVALGLIMIDASPMARIGLAILWPIGPIAFFVTITILLAAVVIAYPLIGLAVLLAGSLAWWALS